MKTTLMIKFSLQPNMIYNKNKYNSFYNRKGWNYLHLLATSPTRPDKNIIRMNYDTCVSGLLTFTYRDVLE